VRALLGSMAATLYGMGLTAPALLAYERALVIAEAEGEPGQVVGLKRAEVVVRGEQQGGAPILNRRARR
jgi:hypothetical protein